jgi:hypothetical protein
MEVIAENLVAREAGGGRTGILPVPGILTTTAHWADEIRKFADLEKSNTFDLARTIWSANKKLLRGEWSELWKSSNRLPFAKRTGEMFAVIGENLGNLHMHTCAHLPTGWTILYQLARLPRLLLEKLIADEVIHPAFKLAAARALVAKFVRHKTKGAPRPNLKLRLRGFRQFILASAGEWTDRERSMICETLQEIVRQLAAPARSASFSLSHHPIVWTPTESLTPTT